MLTNLVNNLKARIEEQDDTIEDLKGKIEILEEGTSQLTACTRSRKMSQCKQLSEAGCQVSDVYTLASGIKVYCDMTTAGGGWQLLLTQTHAMKQYDGTESPFVIDLNPQIPSPTSQYSRNWAQLLKPKVLDEFLLISTADNDYVRFVTSNFCA